mmetsp:Transcript_19760/g.30489  ORF Transcript_19760/g.30489 Transcript_19760/m.30489 type:complete len:340 (+) Transcript_19760:1-1020(+)
MESRKNVLVTGGTGFIGSKLCSKIVKDGAVGDFQVGTLTITDIVSPASDKLHYEYNDKHLSIRHVDLDLAETDGIASLIAETKPDIIFHLGSVVSGEAELNFEKGYRCNVDGMRNLLEAIRALGTSYVPKFIFSSSITCFGPPLPDIISDDFHRTPATSYGTQKAICELLVDDYSRKGYIEGVTIRFPTICVRPGKPNKAASGFFSNIIREPLSGAPAVCPVSRDIRHTVASPRKSIEYLVRAAGLSADQLEGSRAITMPSIPVTVGEMMDALERVAGKDVVSLIEMKPDSFIQKIATGWQYMFDTQKAKSLGFTPDESFEEIIRAHIADELDGKIGCP